MSSDTRATVTPLHCHTSRRGKEEAELQNGLKHGHPAAAHHQVLHGGPLLQHDSAASRDAEDALNQK